MRIITGELKGRRLVSPGDSRIRPTSDVVKEALFSIVAAYPEDGIVIDLFAGTGNLGIEAISRGAKKVYFGDASRDSIALILENLDHCGVSDRAVVLTGDWSRTLERIGEPADLILLDPPYRAGLLEGCIEKIGRLGLLKAEGVIAAEHGSDLELPESIGPFVKEKSRRYGKKSITIFAHSEEA